MDFTSYVIVLIRRWRILAACFVAFTIIGVVYAFGVAKMEYQSQVTFIPPISEGGGLSSIIPGLNLGVTFSPGLSGEQITPLFESVAIRRQLIERFSLISHYKLTKSNARFKLALKKLNKDMAIEVNEQGNLGFSNIISYTVSCYHTSPDTACLMTNFVFGMIDSTVRAISSDRAHRQKVFIEEQLEKSRFVLDSLQKEYRDFQVENKAYDVPEQIKMAVKAYSEIKATELLNEIKLLGLQNNFVNDFPAAMAIQNENIAYKQKLQQLEREDKPEVLMGLSFSADLLPKYENLLRGLEAQNTLIIYLTKEREESRLKEARDVSSLAVIDPPYVAQYKARPKRIMLMGFIICFPMTFVLVFVLLQEFIRTEMKQSPFFKTVLENFKQGNLRNTP